MPLSRNHRSDRRRRVMLDAVIQDPELAAEHSKISRRNRARARALEEDQNEPQTYRDPGYSQAVRRACQQRVVQLIPVRRGMVAVALTVLWLGFGVLVAAHYLLHQAPLDPKKWNLATLPIAKLFDLTAWNGISHWLSCQLWLLTAFACLMTFNLRRHKLDDYRARYRVWALVGLVALFLHFDASTSTLLLVGHTIDPWARAEIGYGGWPLVLATTASLIGVMAIRLCSELKTVPTAVVSWIVGLIMVAVSALIGTGLIKTPWEPPALKTISGSLWLGGALFVFQAIAMYLRHTYIQAQKRFLIRTGVHSKPIQLKMPKLNWKQVGVETDQKENTDRRRWRDRLPWIGRHREENDEYEDDHHLRKDESLSPSTQSGLPAEPKAPQVQAKKLFGVIPNRQLANETTIAQPISEDDGGEIDRGLTKKQGWFGIGGNKAAQPASTTSRIERPLSKPTQEQSVDERQKRQTRQDEETPERGERSWLGWKRKPSQTASKSTGGNTDSQSQVSRRGWGTMLDPRSVFRGLKRQPKNDGREPSKPATKSDAKDSEKKSGLFGLRKKSHEPTDTKKPEPKPPKPPKEKRSWFSMFDGLKLQPPEPMENKAEKPATPAPLRQATVQNAPRPSTQAYQDDYGEERPLSKAERKRLRQQNDRRAA